MRIFENGNWSHGNVCPICKTNKSGKVILIGIQGTEEDNIMEAKQFHLDCINLLYYKNEEFHCIYQKFGK